MNYRLAVLTHGRHSPLDRAIESFIENLFPAPGAFVIHGDGPDTQSEAQRAGERLLEAYGPIPGGVVVGSDRRRGFCEATRFLWELAAGTPDEGITHVFWLEHDFEFARPVDLEVLARIMAGQAAFAKEPLAQMTLMRQPVNDAERDAGSVVGSMTGSFQEMGGWLRHDRYFTTNPSLMTREFMVMNPFPNEIRECEGRFGLMLRSRGYHFGVWGDGTPWVEHVGVRTGHGY